MPGLKALLEVASALVSFDRPWFVSGGWAIDLYAGRVTREHHDIDVAIFRRDQLRLRQRLRGFECRKIVPDPEGRANRGMISEWPRSEQLELPIHQINAYRAGAEAPAFQIMLAETEGSDWFYRRDPTIRRPLAAIGFEHLWNLPYLAPEILLLFKSKATRSEDRADFATALPLLGADARRWLRESLTRCQPGHEWIARL